MRRVDEGEVVALPPAVLRGSMQRRQRKSKAVRGCTRTEECSHDLMYVIVIETAASAYVYIGKKSIGTHGSVRNTNRKAGRVG